MKEYAVYIAIEEQVENLKPGMTAEVEIQINRLEDVLAIPVQAVVQKGEQNYCYVADASKVEERPVALGDSNDVLVEIKDGVNQGDRVILNPRAVIPEAREPAFQTEPKKNGNGSSPLRKQEPK